MRAISRATTVLTLCCLSWLTLRCGSGDDGSDLTGPSGIAGGPAAGGSATTGGAAGRVTTGGGTSASAGAGNATNGKGGAGAVAAGGGIGGAGNAAGQANGGQANGGQATGGQANGGQANGGQATGGQANGGQATGGQATGGQATGGQATGGQATGGQGTGGDGLGGQTTGGAPSGGSGGGGAGSACCGSDAQCPSLVLTQRCAEGVCKSVPLLPEDGSCWVDGECSGGRPKCVMESVCGCGEVGCNAQDDRRGTCVPAACCAADTDCDGGLVCRRPGGSGLGRCSPKPNGNACYRDGDCPKNQSCHGGPKLCACADGPACTPKLGTCGN